MLLGFLRQLLSYIHNSYLNLGCKFNSYRFALAILT